MRSRGNPYRHRLHPKRYARKTMISTEEFKQMLDEAKKRPHPYYVLRDSAIVCIFKRTGKRRQEVAWLEVEDVLIKERYLSITFTVVKKRKGSVSSFRREKLISLKDPATKIILEYLNYYLNHPHFLDASELAKGDKEMKLYLFPTTHYDWFTNTLTLKPWRHLSGQQLLRIVQKLDPLTWCHLFRETMGAEVVRRDPSIAAPFKVKQRLDLESYITAFHYMERFRPDIIEYEEEKPDIIE